jgi:hypothetical protein
MTAFTLPEALRACESVADPGAARQAAAAWEQATMHGWEAVRAALPRSTFFRHLRLLRRAGLPVPGTRAPGARPGTEVPPAPEFRDAATDLAGWLHAAGGLLGLPGRRFRLVHDLAGGEPPGTPGTVYGVLFRDNRWRVSYELDAYPGLFEEIDLGRFARGTVWTADTGDGSTS